MKRRLASALLLTLSLTGVPSAATAAVSPIEDVRGDGFGDDLDIVGGSLENGEHQCVVTVDVARVRQGAAMAVLDSRSPRRNVDHCQQMARP